MSSGDWICCSCQHMNFKKRDSCQRCGCPKFGGGVDVPLLGLNRTEVLPGDWYCNVINCGAHNYASRPNCYKCGATKNDYCNVYGGGVEASAGGGLPGWKTGDWICARVGCGAHNYACRMECFKCGAPRT
ncbi:uncharacterized protein LOC131335473 [Rhododendron vialii]|uniref:uncharacterized protein LOC131335473 n=1 Tax=Rhododendron vialii TaxID=182163 RepID=UPI00265D78E4|nr:uncharacterized protein LOC131335473 [Rhododendron vialii]